MRFRPELSKKSDYYISKHRMYELKYFCLQYPEWKKQYLFLDGLTKVPDDLVRYSTNIGDPTYKCFELREKYLMKMRDVEQAAIEADPDIYTYLIKAVTEGRSYEYLKTKMHIPCGRDYYYRKYRKFFYILDILRENL